MLDVQAANRIAATDTRWLILFMAKILCFCREIAA
jgi:hypothetical protein